ncbi:Endothelin-converting enzyme 1 [Orchesella cincta]|uniref:Endothelin-converting enzyme 1 n=1 Tax=Orchesella cincta TaxID=48709 RepID=A0A1D2NLA0_ORCCI|nr:Endothelin-converting enzyme 1 [Orchesella cincta]
MDPKTNPCEDFYQFACGSYIEKHPPLKKVPDGEPIYLHREGIPVDFSQNEKIGNFLKKVSSFPENQLLPFYQACIDSKRRDEQGIRPLVHLLAQVRILAPQAGPFSANHRFNVARVMGRIFRKTNRLFFVDFDGVVDNVIVFKLSKPATDVLMTPPEIYAETMRKAWRLLARDLYIGGEEEIDTIVYLVMKFEAELSIIRTKGAESSVFGFPSNFNSYVPKPEKYHSNFVRLRGHFEWDDLLAAIFDYKEGHYEEYQVFFNLWSSFYSKEDRFFLMYLQDTLKNTPAYTIFRYMQWELIKVFAFDLSKDMQDTMLYIYPSSGSTLIARCFRSVFSNLHVLAAHRFKMLVENPDAIDHNMTMLSDKIFDTYVDAIQQLELPAALKASLLATSKTLKVVIEPLSGLRPHLKVFYDSLNASSDHFINVVQARSIKARNAVIKVKREPPFHKWIDGEYSLTEITQMSFADSWSTIRYMHIPFAAMQEPYMDNNLPILDYAGFGQYVVSVFLVQNALEDVFQLYDTYSKIFEPRAEVKLVKGLQKALFERVDCVVRSFENISLKNHPELKLNTEIPTIRMNMLANTFAVELTMLVIDTIYNSTTSLTEAEKASPIYELQHAKGKLTKKFPKYQILPGLEKYSPRQLAFLSIARQNCQTFSKDRVEHRMDHGPLLREIRIKGSFRNSPVFAQAWKCPKESFMNPKKKCVILLGEKVKSEFNSQEVESSEYDEEFDEDSHSHNHDD